ncbi:MAG: hypothetical protein ACFFB3_20140 [Candidatus Hodarchaeota archaeon]
MSKLSGTEMKISLGFWVCSSVAMIITFLALGKMTVSQLESLWIIAIAIGFINHGVWDHDLPTILGGIISSIMTLLSLAFAPQFFPVGWIILGGAMILSRFYFFSKAQRSYTGLLIPIYITFGGIVRFLAVYLEISYLASWMVWMVLIGLMFIAIGMETNNSVVYLVGASWIVVSVSTYIFDPNLVFFALIPVFVIGMAANFIHLYRLFGRTPKLGEIFSFTSRALFLHGLKKPIDQYRVLAVLTKGNVGVESVIQDLISRLEPMCETILLLGPTAPTQLSLPEEVKIGWITTVSGMSDLGYPIRSPEDPSMVNVFLTKTLETVPENKRPVILGDFLDNMIPHMDEALFYKFYSDLASAARILNNTIVCVVDSSLHSEIDINIVKRFADVIIENREREAKGRRIREVRVSNRVDNIHTNWEKY